jgi:hypothetical protein
MSFGVPSSALDKQHLKKDFGIILAGTSFQGFGIHSYVIYADDLFILPRDLNI